MLLSLSLLLHADANSCNRILDEALAADHLTVEFDLGGVVSANGFAVDIVQAARELSEQAAGLIAARLLAGQPTYRWDDVECDWPHVDVMRADDLRLLAA